MEDNQAFRNATDFLKKKKDVTMIVVAKKLGVSRQVVDNIRRGSQRPSKDLVGKLIFEFPEVADYFAESAKQPVKAYEKSGIDLLVDLDDTQKQLIELQKNRLKYLEEKVEQHLRSSAPHGEKTAHPSGITTYHRNRLTISRIPIYFFRRCSFGCRIFAA